MQLVHVRSIFQLTEFDQGLAFVGISSRLQSRQETDSALVDMLTASLFGFWMFFFFNSLYIFCYVFKHICNYLYMLAVSGGMNQLILCRHTELGVWLPF